MILFALSVCTLESIYELDGSFHITSDAGEVIVVFGYLTYCLQIVEDRRELLMES